MAYDTEVDRMLADPRLSSVLDDWATRLKDGRPYRWHRAIDTTTGPTRGYEWHAGPDLALVTDMAWRLAQHGITTTIVSEWRTHA